MDASVIFMSMPHPSTPVQHISEQCPTCVARIQRHRRRSNNHNLETQSMEDNDDNGNPPELAETNLEEQLSLTTTTTDSNIPLSPPPPYSRRRRHQRLDLDPPTYASVLVTPPPGQPITRIPVTIRYIETLILEDDGYSKVVCPTARKFKTELQIYPSMAWDRFWECLRQASPAVTMREESLREVRALRRKGKWERLVCSRLAAGVKLKEGNWEEVRTAICDGSIDKVVVAA